jgi:carbamoyl-phosphate synthase large subunit
VWETEITFVKIIFHKGDSLMLNILIPSAGRRYLHIKYFRECKGVNKVITTDIDFLAPGIHAADACYKCPPTGSQEYLDTILKICQKENINAIIPLMDLDIVQYSNHRQKFEKQGIKLLLHPPETIEIAMDKLKTAEFLRNNGLPSPKTCIAFQDGFETIPYPFLCKPRFPELKAKSNYIFSVIHDQHELEELKIQLEDNEENFIFQDYLDGTELTVDFFCQKNGDYVLAIPANRISALTTAFSKNGGTMDKGWTFHDDEIEEMVIKATKIMDFYGPANFGGYRSEDGITKITEINARLTGGATLSVLGSGINLFQWSIDLLEGKEITPPDGGFVETVMTSYVEPVFFPRGKNLFDEV